MHLLMCIEQVEYSSINAFILPQIDSIGNLLWGNINAFIDEYSTCSIHKGYPEGYIISASSYLYGANANDAFLLKTDDDGIGCGAMPYTLDTNNPLSDIHPSG